MTTKTIRVLFFKEGETWVAQCLEFDIAAQGASIKHAREAFIEVFTGQISLDLSKNREPLSEKKQAPHWYWQWLRDAEPLRDIELDDRQDSPAASVCRTAEAWVC